MNSFVVLIILGLSLLTYCSATDAVLVNVMQEQFVAKAYIKIILQMQSGIHGSRAGMQFAQAAVLTSVKNPPNDKQILATRINLSGVVTSYVDIKAQKYLTIIGAEDAQMDFYMDRIAQLQIQSLGSQVPSQLYFLIYMKFYLSYLKTMKFSLTFKFLSAIVSFYEDWGDSGVFAVQNARSFDKEELQDLLIDKLFTFTSLFELKQTELIVFYLQWYMDYITMALSGQQSMSMMGTNMWSKMLNLYSLMYIYSGSQCAVQSSVMNYAAFVNRGQENAQSLDAMGNQQFACFGQAYAMSSQINYLNAMFSIYSLYAPYMYQAYAAQSQHQQTNTTQPTA